MTYARARLALGVTGVGSLVTLATIVLFSGIPHKYLSSETLLSGSEIMQLSGVVGLFMLWLMPLDFLGGYLFPKRFGRTDQRVQTWFAEYLPAAVGQGALFILFGMVILITNRAGGTLAVILALTFGVGVCFAFRNHRLVVRKVNSPQSSKKISDAIAITQSWQIFVPRTIVVDHRDVGFTGGIIGFRESATIVIPMAWLGFTREELATAIARRAMAIESGSYTKGLIVALAWNILGFLFCSMLPGAGLASVAELVTTVSGFTLWSFLGLLTLPTASRNASLKIDQTLVEKGMSPQFISNTASSIDQMQDNEPERTALIETIFHPVPNVSSRNSIRPVRGLAAWNVARTTLFFSWVCLGFLSRAVHCNVGRPELWTMLPTD